MSPHSTIPMHGRDHCHEGADPIPCMPGASPGSVTYGDYVTSFSTLLGYWKLGETDEPLADSSGHAGGPATLGENLSGSGTPITYDVTGALPAAQDDGAAQFNTPDAVGVYLRDEGSHPYRFNHTADITLAAWVKPIAHAGSWYGQVLGCWYLAAGFGGYRLRVSWPSRTPHFQRKQEVGTDVMVSGAGTLLTTEWYLLTGTYSETDGACLYVNGVLVDSDPTLFDASVPNIEPSIGGHAAGGEPFYGGIDEAAIWEQAFTAAEVANLYAAATEESGPAGSYVLISDGAGGSSWGKVTSPAIEDDTIVDADVSPTAGLAVTKLAQGTDGQILTTVAGAPAWAAPAIPDPADDPAVWMPLSTVVAGVPELVWDGDDNLIPTLTPI